MMTGLIGRLFGLLILAAPQMASGTAFGTDYSDLWWNPAESGWGIQFVQEYDTIFATMFVYGTDNKPTWYSATLIATASGTPIASGDLVLTSGPYFGQQAFNAAAVTVRKVGTITLALAGLTSSSRTLSYSVDGVSVTKTIQRQTLVNENVGGTFVGAINFIPRSGNCSNFPQGNGLPATVSITHSRGSLASFVLSTSAGVCSVTGGTFSQSGHVGQIDGNAVCPHGETGSMGLDQISVSKSALSAAISVFSNSGCLADGNFSGVRQ